uniref:Dynein regulatory complex protein 12 n=2 Tax=Macrostomum lignano TaxID=282301 RepID=A0A1I8HJX9_9PLAT
MPPKKKGKKGGKKKKDPAVLEMEEKVARGIKENMSLREGIAQRKDLTRKALAAGVEAASTKDGAVRELEEMQEEAADVNAYMSKQYKMMQAQMGLQVNQLERDLHRANEDLAERTAELADLRRELERTVREKDEKISSLELKMQNLHSQYQNMLHSSLDSLIEKLKSEWLGFEEKETGLHQQYKSALLEFGLNTHDI